ncbi:putative uncharacterized protein [Prevotella sp. CAG:1185]|nr:putative uncharacterized protein [Prevotella sp. CAG:1185]
MEKDVLQDLRLKLTKDSLRNEILQNGYQKTFDKIAKILLNKVAICKGEKIFYIKDIEFYLYENNHRDIVTYPRICKAGQWFFHPSGIDISFESSVDVKSNDYELFQPILRDDAFFGGVLIRAIYPADKAPSDACKYSLDGPHKVEWALFDCFDAFNETTNFPHLIECEHKIEHITKPRKNLIPKENDYRKKIETILNYYYEDSPVSIDEWINIYKSFEKKTYRYMVR